MGVLKRLLRQTSRKLLAKIAPPRQSHQLVLNSPLDGAAAHHHGPGQRQSSRRIAAALHRKLRKKSARALKESAVSDALLLAAKNYLPPVQFHHVHGPNAQLSKNKFVARRTQSFCHALVFSNRVILPNERVYIKVLDIAKGWSGTIRFGFTAVDPATLACRMPKHACPDMTNARPSHTWARALADEVVKRNSVIHFSYNKNGFIHYGINNQDCGIFFANVNTKQNLWFIVDVYGLTAAVELIDPRVHNAAGEIDFERLDEQLGAADAPLSTMYKSTSAMEDLFGRYSAGPRQAKKSRRRAKLPASNRPAAALLQWQPQTTRDQMMLSSHSLAANSAFARQAADQLPNLSSLAYPCAQQNIYSPMPVQEHPARATAHDYHQILANNSAAYHQIGPNNVALLPALSTPNLAVALGSRHHQQQQQQRNNLNNSVQTDERQICHQLESVQLCDSRPPPATGANNKSILSTASKSSATVGKQTTPVAAARTRVAPPPSSSSSAASATAGPKSRTSEQHRAQPSSTSSRGATSSVHQSSVKPKARHSIKSSQKCSPLSSVSSSASANSSPMSASANKENNNPPSKDCPICFERPINCVLYQCGHMCTCYECGVKQWKTQSRTCPICRTIIKDVIKTYMS